MDYPRFDELFALARDEMLTRNPALRRDVIEAEGTDANALCAGIATAAEEVVRQVAVTARDRMLSTAVGEELDRLAFDFYGLVRNDAVASLVSLTFTRAGGAGGVVPAGSKCSTPAGIEFQTIDALVFPGGVLALSTNARCTLTGTPGNVAAGQVTILKFTAFDLTMTVTNVAAAAGGSVRETDDEFQGRIRQWWATLRRATLGAIEFGGLEQDGVGICRAYETPLQVVPGYGLPAVTVGMAVSLIVADRSGTANAILQAVVTTALDDYRAAGVYVAVIAAATVWQDVAVTFSWLAGQDASAATQRIRDAVLQYVNGLRVGETLRRGAIARIVQDDSSVAYGTVVVVTPSGDVVASATQLIRTTADRVGVN